jgi:hypothetical protein
MRDDLTTNLHISAHLGGVAPTRHELARQQHVEKLMARHEAEQRAATIGQAMRAMVQFWSLLRIAFAPTHSIGTPASRRRSLPAE